MVFSGGSMEPPLGTNGSKSTLVTYVLKTKCMLNSNPSWKSSLHMTLSDEIHFHEQSSYYDQLGINCCNWPWSPELFSQKSVFGGIFQPSSKSMHW